MNISDKPPYTPAEFTNMILQDSLPRLQNIAWRTVNIHQLTNTDFVVACIQVDSPWRTLVDSLVPRQNWQAMRDTGVEPFIEGSTTWKLCDVVAESFPSLSKVVYEVPEEDLVKAFILTVAGCGVYDIVPKPRQ